ncbi:MAG: alpha/beta fold hydrolase [Planctomycetota bacterium]
MSTRRPLLVTHLRVLALGLAAVVGTACSSPPPVRVEPRSEAQLRQELDTCALYLDGLSSRTAWLLHITETEARFSEDPRATLRALHERVVSEPGAAPLFAMAELAYLAGKRTRDPGCYLAAAVYAYSYLLPAEVTRTPSAYDRRFRWACDIYNRSLAKAFEDPKSGKLALTAGPRAVPMGTVDVQVDVSAFPFPTEGVELLPTDELGVVGLGFRVRDSGLGAPLIAVARQRGDGTAGVGISDRTSVSATAFLRLGGGLENLAGGLSATLELHSTSDSTAVEVAGHAVPLEADQSATVAYGIESADLWRFDLAGLFKGRDASRQNGLILPRPYQPGRIPVVLVHGTASNPAYWAELMNTLSADELLRSRYQFWLFLYATGNPIAYSAATLRRSLAQVLAQHDPQGEDEALRRMVIVGHSQGGLLTKLMGVHIPIDEMTQQVLGRPFAELGLAPDDEALMRECFDVEPLDYVERLVFVATPHHGSFLATRWYSRLFAKLIAVPGEVTGVATRLFSSTAHERLPPGMEPRVPTSLDNMDPKSHFLRFLAATPLDPRIRAHSIIPIGDAEEPAGANDGVVEYESAHIEGVESELLVPSPHSCQSHPRTMIELRRILREHLESAKP